MKQKLSSDVRLGLLAAAVTAGVLAFAHYARGADAPGEPTFRMYGDVDQFVGKRAPARVVAPDKDRMISKLRTLAGGRDIPEPVPTPVQGIFETKVGGSVTYVTADGNFAFVGSLIDLTKRENLTRNRLNEEAQIAIEAFGEENMLVFPAHGKVLGKLTVFTDPTCAYCRKVHQEMDILRAGGVTVRYIPFVRIGMDTVPAEQLETVWCADDPLAAMDTIMGTREGELGDKNDCDNAASVKKGFELAMLLGLQGTPVLFVEEGQRIDGYVPAERITAAVLAISKREGEGATGG